MTERHVLRWIPCGGWAAPRTPRRPTCRQYDKSTAPHAYYLRVICPTCQVVVFVVRRAVRARAVREVHVVDVPSPHSALPAATTPTARPPSARHFVPLHRAGPEPGLHPTDVTAPQFPADPAPKNPKKSSQL
ncbi:hypothetical protein GCM10010329_19570 [Streptomyces spiroverticillatus]|uniref:Uncharacterized protein n=1 Tax=Streptomyces finlayi TaxID=67296 RepID=A0A918WTW4_9ACTN|nr:hypothetical protein GCM10010329_19570 [Streptomyces spiroverticillatus]GHC83170.1 hypothetical protein GCM10010334_12010 [Streptomyces finlayi]